MPRSRKQPSVPPMPVAFVETAAQSEGTVIEVIDLGPGRAKEKRRRRYHLLHTLAQPRNYGSGRVFPPRITRRQQDAGERLHEAWCETMRSPTGTNEYVDKSVDWDGIALANAERIGKFAEVSQHLPQRYRDVVLTVVIHQVMVEDIDALRAGLNAVADGLRL